jgi:hypothetical protein
MNWEKLDLHIENLIPGIVLAKPPLLAQRTREKWGTRILPSRAIQLPQLTVAISIRYNRELIRSLPNKP